MKAGPLPGHMLIANKSRMGRVRSSVDTVQPAIRLLEEKPGGKGETEFVDELAETNGGVVRASDRGTEEEE